MPDFKKIVRERIASLRLKGTAEADLAEELAQHLEDRYQELRSGGATEEEAYRKCVSELDELHPLRTELERSEQMPRYDAVPAGDVSTSNFAEDLWRDLRYTGRAIRKNPLFVLFVVLTLALGIGANTTVFTIINTLLLNPLPVPDSSELISLTVSEVKSGSKSTTRLPVSLANLKDYQARNEAFRSLAGYSTERVVTLQTGGDSQRMFAELVTSNYFSALGLSPAQGRFFSPEEDSASGAHPVAVMNHATWQMRFGGANDIIGKTLRINGVALTVIGVAPPGFIGISAIFGPDLWVPATMAEQLWPSEMRGSLTDRGKTVFLGVGRLRPGVSREQGQANVTAIAAALAREYPNVNENRTATLRPITDVLFGSDNTGNGRTPVLLGSLVLMAIVGIVLLIACSNVANLLLARAAARQQEMAVRLAIGASRGRLIRQLLTESVVLGLLSGLAGVSAGYAGSRFLWSFFPADVTTNLMTLKLDTTVLLFSLAIALLTGFVFGMIPALRASRTNVAETLKEESRSVGRSRRRITLANALLVGQVAFSFLSLMTAALFLRSMQKAYEIDPGFQTKNLAIFLTNPGQAGYGKERTKAFYKNVRDRVERMPGVASVSWALSLPLWGRAVNGLEIEGRPKRSKTDTISTAFNAVDLRYFETMNIPILRGRDFNEMDQEHSTPVAIVNEKFAHDYWPNQEALGKRVQIPGEAFLRQVVGIAKTANYSSLAEPPQVCVYVPSEQYYSDGMTLHVRSKGDPQQLLVPIQREVRIAGPQILVDDARTGTKLIGQALFSPRIGVALLGVFGMLALGLASIGLYGIMAYSVSQRKREIGVRMAMGAAQKNVLWLVLKQGLSLVSMGVFIGLVAALAVGSLLSKMLYGVSAADPASMAGAALVLLVVALVACYLPARWASRVDPLVALREG